MFSIKHNKVDNRFIIESRKAFTCTNFNKEILVKAFALTILVMIQQPVWQNVSEESNCVNHQCYSIQ